MACALVVLAATSATAQETELVRSTFYRCEEASGLRTYTTKPIKDADCKVISFEQATKPAPGWVLVGLDERGAAGLLYYLDRSISRSGRSASVWVMTSYAANMAAQNVGTFRSSVERWKVDCLDKSMGTQQTTYYASTFGTGNVVGTWRPVMGPSTLFAIPNSAGEAIVNAACRKPPKAG
jgi:hypothetical protein